MTVQRLEHIGIVVDDLAAATAFFAALGHPTPGGGGWPRRDQLVRSS